MPRAKLTLTPPEGVWIGDLSREHPEARLRILAALPDDEAGFGLIEVTAPDLEGVLSTMREIDHVSSFDLLQVHDDTALVQFETSNPVLLFPVRDSGVPLEMPFEIGDGEVHWEVTAPRERLSALGEQLDAFDIPFTVEYIRREIEAEALLTDRQRRLLDTAIELGYYDTPRTCSLTELADEMGIAKSTCSETLHRAEGKVIKQFVEDQSTDRIVATE